MLSTVSKCFIFLNDEIWTVFLHKTLKNIHTYHHNLKSVFATNSMFTTHEKHEWAVLNAFSIGN